MQLKDVKEQEADREIIGNLCSPVVSHKSKMLSSEKANSIL